MVDLEAVVMAFSAPRSKVDLESFWFWRDLNLELCLELIETRGEISIGPKNAVFLESSVDNLAGLYGVFARASGGGV